MIIVWLIYWNLTPIWCILRIPRHYHILRFKPLPLQAKIDPDLAPSTSKICVLWNEKESLEQLPIMVVTVELDCCATTIASVLSPPCTTSFQNFPYGHETASLWNQETETFFSSSSRFCVTIFCYLRRNILLTDWFVSKSQSSTGSFWFLIVYRILLDSSLFVTIHFLMSKKSYAETSYLQHATHGFEEFSITNKMVSPLIKIVSLQECVQNTPWSLKMIAHFDIFLDISKAHRVPQDQTIYFERTTYNNQTSIDSSR